MSERVSKARESQNGETYIELLSTNGDKMRKNRIKVADILKIEKKRKFLHDLEECGIEGLKNRAVSPIESGESKFLKKFVPKTESKMA